MNRMMGAVDCFHTFCKFENGNRVYLANDLSYFDRCQLYFAWLESNSEDRCLTYMNESEAL